MLPVKIKSHTSSTEDVFKTNTRFPGSQYIFKNAEKILSIPSPLYTYKIKLYNMRNKALENETYLTISSLCHSNNNGKNNGLIVNVNTIFTKKLYVLSHDKKTIFLKCIKEYLIFIFQ